LTPPWELTAFAAATKKNSAPRTGGAESYALSSSGRKPLDSNQRSQCDELQAVRLSLACLVARAHDSIGAAHQEPPLARLVQLGTYPRERATDQIRFNCDAVS
jgi:hypothetical protein